MIQSNRKRVQETNTIIQKESDNEQQSDDSDDEELRTSLYKSQKEENSFNFDPSQKNKNYKMLTEKEEEYINIIINLNKKGVKLIKSSKQKEALIQLSKAEKMLEFGATCGKRIDRNLIIVILFNQACAYQGQWQLDKSQTYLDGAIYNLEQIIKDEQGEITSTLTDNNRALAVLMQRQTFLAKAFLQQCAILSQLGNHDRALELAKKTTEILQGVFQAGYDFVTQQKINDQYQQSSNSHINESKRPINCNVTTLSQQNTSCINISTTSTSEQQKSLITQDSQKDKSLSKDTSLLQQQIAFQKKSEVAFSMLVMEQAETFLRDMQRVNYQGVVNEKNVLDKAKQQIYFWKNNPENNEKQIRMELQLPLLTKDEDMRSILGVQNGLDWMQNFNIGTIMHMNPLLYEEFCLYGEMVYELQKKLLLEKIVYMSISFFTIATELRFQHLDSLEMQGIKEQQPDKTSELYHLKAIELACKYITCSTPYINHLITSYHKHYKQNLDTIVIIVSLIHKLISQRNPFLADRFDSNFEQLKVIPSFKSQMNVKLQQKPPLNPEKYIEEIQGSPKGIKNYQSFVTVTDGQSPNRTNNQTKYLNNFIGAKLLNNSNNSQIQKNKNPSEKVMESKNYQLLQQIMSNIAVQQRKVVTQEVSRGAKPNVGSPEHTKSTYNQVKIQLGQIQIKQQQKNCTQSLTQEIEHKLKSNLFQSKSPEIKLNNRIDFSDQVIQNKIQSRTKIGDFITNHEQLSKPPLLNYTPRQPDRDSGAKKLGKLLQLNIGSLTARQVKQNEEPSSQRNSAKYSFVTVDKRTLSFEKNHQSLQGQIKQAQNTSRPLTRGSEIEKMNNNKVLLNSGNLTERSQYSSNHNQDFFKQFKSPKCSQEQSQYIKLLSKFDSYIANQEKKS